MKHNHRTRTSGIVAMLFSTALSLGISSSVDAKTKPRISMEKARAIALATVPGKIIEEELEREHGRRIYSFEIAPTGGPAGAIKEVNIDAADGSVVAIEDESSDDDHD